MQSIQSNPAKSTWDKEPPCATATTIAEQGRILQLHWSDGRCNQYHAVWLRDHGQDINTRDPENQQKLITLRDIPKEQRINAAIIKDTGQIEISFTPGNVTTQIGAQWLRTNCYDTPKAPSLLEDHLITWGKEIEGDAPTACFDEIHSDPQSLRHWLGVINTHGFATLSGLPEKSNSVLDVISLFGFVRETNYGPVFEVRTEAKPVNLAFTGKGLQVHTDNPYRDPVPTLQLLACLRNDADGGDSVVVDGFKAAQILHDESPEYFQLLSSHSAKFVYRGSDDTHLCASKPILERSPEGQLLCVRFNNRSCDALTNIPFDKMEDYYRAYRRFGEILESDDLKVTFKLQPNELFIVDNTRVLHGRTSFSGAGRRWLQGAYADKDSLQSKLRTLERRLN